jgi:hypothetical protein
MTGSPVFLSERLGESRLFPERSLGRLAAPASPRSARNLQTSQPFFNGLQAQLEGLAAGIGPGGPFKAVHAPFFSTTSLERQVHVCRSSILRLLGAVARFVCGIRRSLHGH